jgi:hypothetical protein
MESTEHWLGLDPITAFGVLPCATIRRVFVQGEMTPDTVVILLVTSKKDRGVSDIQYNDMVQHVSTYRPDDPFRKAVLPGRPRIRD